MENGKIAIRQFIVLVTMFVIGSSILLVPAALAVDAKQDAWISAIVGTSVGLLLIVMLGKLAGRFPDMTLVQMSEWLLGKWLGKLVGLSYFVFAFLLSVFMLRYIGDFMTSQMMTETPIEAIHILFLTIVVMGVLLGLETYTRTAEIMFPWVTLFFVTLAILVAPQFQSQFIQPVLAHGIKPVLRGSFPLIGIPFLEVVLLLMLMPSVAEPKRRLKGFLIGGCIGGMLIFGVTIVSILVLGPEMTVRDIYPSYVLTKKINIGHFLQRIEAILAVVWFFTIYFKLTITFYVSALILAQVLGLPRIRPLVMPLALHVLVLALVVYPNIMYGIQFAGKMWTPFAMTFGLALPLLLLAVSFIRRRKSAPPL